jgi:hypothetical protein
MKAVLNAFEVLLAEILKVFNLEHHRILFPDWRVPGSPGSLTLDQK